ncbi:hypothetical protein U14_00464 [Candidatus Moduliflexus flocculans]|uniref:Curli production assembly/transport component CsgG n=1 Tax=Candidatus Moduliflexus flocculans TaxID=1499966 RepID=A0A0S6VUD8_9BACT|nr:hypothetical protein U14_00464 [Candidatus Moduliflexus flocculans]
MKTLLKGLILFVLCIATSAAHGSEKVAVLDFKSIMAPEDLGIAVAEILRTELVGIGNYMVIERGMLEELLKEQQLQLTGAVDSETAVEIGKLVGAKLVVIGSIVKTGSVYTINSRFIDVETGIAKVGQNIRGQGEDQISNMVHQLALIIAGKTVTEEPMPGKTRPLAVPKLLFSFETDADAAQWQPFAEPPKTITRVRQHATDGDYALQVIFPKKREYPEIDTTHAPQDWSGEEVFAFDLYWEATPNAKEWHLAVRIDDATTTPQNQHWFDEAFPIISGSQTIRIPIPQISQRVDVRQITRVMLFVNDLSQEVEVYLDAFRFETLHAAVPIAPSAQSGFRFTFEDQQQIDMWQPTGSDQRISLKLSDKYASEGRYSLMAELPKRSSDNEYPGIQTRQFPKDWSGYAHFVANIYVEEGANKKKAFTPILAVRIDDVNSTAYENRFNFENVELRPGWNEVKIPIATIGEILDLTAIENIHLFLDQPKEKTRLYFDDIRLE